MENLFITVNLQSYFAEQLSENLSTDTIAKDIMVNEELNCVRPEKSSEIIANANSHSVENSADEFNNQSSQSADDCIIDVDTYESNEEIIFCDEPFMEQAEIYEISDSEDVQNSFKSDLRIVNIRESVQNAIEIVPNSIQTFQTQSSVDEPTSSAILYIEPTKNSITEQPVEDYINLVTSESEEEYFNDRNPNINEKTKKNTRNTQRIHDLQVSKEIHRPAGNNGETMRKRISDGRSTTKRRALECPFCSKAFVSHKNLEIHKCDTKFKCSRKKNQRKPYSKIHGS